MKRFDLPAQYKAKILNRFTSYVAFDTQSNDQVPDTVCPTSSGQQQLAMALADELIDLGASDVKLDANGYLYATVPSNLPPDHPAAGKVPVIGLMAHLDTATEESGAEVKPQIIPNYDGTDITYPDDPNLILSVAANPELRECVGHLLVTAGGKTLLGADDKAGIAEVMTIIDYLLHEDVKHGEIRVCFSPDEEIGRGMDKIDLKLFPVNCAYTLDGGRLGEIEDECFNAATATVTVHGRVVHPGYAKGKLINPLRVIAWIIDRLPEHELPETTEGYQPYRYPIKFDGLPTAERLSLHFLLRAFTDRQLAEMESELRRLVGETFIKFPGVKVDIKVKQQYRNMKTVLDKHPIVMEALTGACAAQEISPIRKPIRGGTDGSTLSIVHGVPTPNVWSGAMNMHGRLEWVSLEWMTSAVETMLVALTDLWLELGSR